MKEYPVTEYKGFSFQPVVETSESGMDDSTVWYEYTIKGWRGRRKCVIKGKSLHHDPENAAQAAIKFSKAKIDDHVSKYDSSFLYRVICSIGYCPASKY